MPSLTPERLTIEQEPGWHQLSPSQALERLASNCDSGLASSEAIERLAAFGKNELIETDRRTALKIFVTQLQSSLVLLLFVVMLVSMIVGEVNDAIAVLAIIILNTLLGFWQDYRAEKSLAELKKLSVPEVAVRRGGTTSNINSSELVPGDVVVLQSGYFIPADCRLIEVNDLLVDESALTGESMPVEKTVESLGEAKLPVGDQTNLGFMGTMIVRGHGLAVVAATGMQTKLGQIASSLQSVETEPTPLQIRLGQLSRTLAVLALLIVSLVFVSGLLVGQDAKLMLMTALSLAVAVVPEGLPAVATVALAIGARRMFTQNALIRQLPAVETLGSVSVICSDKTGTLTENKMTASILDVANFRVVVDQDAACADSVAMQLLLVAGCLCNDAQLNQNADGLVGQAINQPPAAVGEPTEKALVEIAAQFELSQPQLQSAFPRIAEIAFSSERKRMTTLHRIETEIAASAAPQLSGLFHHRQVAFVKGGVDTLLEICNRVWVDDHCESMDAQWHTRINHSLQAMAAAGTRVLAIGFRPIDPDQSVSDLESEVIFVGLVGLTDPPRADVKTAVARCRQAGIRPIMITGDHPLTAVSIAKQLGITSTDSVVTGQELNDMPVETLRQRVRDVSVFARVAPADKLHIVEALQHNREVVAMTGDGINDAPALKQANVGVAMGRNGTDVSKQAADVVLLDDHFETIVLAVEQGRIVYANVKKFVKYTMSSNMGEVLVMTLGVLFGFPLPLLPLQILWVNLVTDGLPGLALAMEPVEKKTMERPPISPGEPIFNRRMWFDVIWIGTMIGGVSLFAGNYLSTSENVVHWRTVIFSALTFAQMGNALAIRSDRPSFFSDNTRPNPWLWGAIAITCLLQIAVIYVPLLQNIFHTQALSVIELAGSLATGVFVFASVEIVKSVLGFVAKRNSE